MRSLRRDQRLRHRSAAGQARYEALGQRREQVHEFECTQRRRRSRLDDAAVAGGERGGHGPAGNQNREIERDDVNADAERLVARVLERSDLGRAGHLAGLVASHLGVITEDRGAVRQLADRLGVRFAHLAGHEFRAAAHVGRLDRCRERMQGFCAGLGVTPHPRPLRTRHCIECRLDIGHFAIGEQPNRLERRRVDNPVYGSRGGPVHGVDEVGRGLRTEAHGAGASCRCSRPAPAHRIM